MTKNYCNRPRPTHIAEIPRRYHWPDPYPHVCHREPPRRWRLFHIAKFQIAHDYCFLVKFQTRRTGSERKHHKTPCKCADEITRVHLYFLSKTHNFLVVKHSSRTSETYLEVVCRVFEFTLSRRYLLYDDDDDDDDMLTREWNDNMDDTHSAPPRHSHTEETHTISRFDCHSGCAWCLYGDGCFIILPRPAGQRRDRPAGPGLGAAGTSRWSAASPPAPAICSGFGRSGFARRRHFSMSQIEESTFGFDNTKMTMYFCWQRNDCCSIGCRGCSSRATRQTAAQLE